MKKISTLFILAVLVATQSATAQDNKIEEFGYFDHLGAGISVGVIDGIGVDLAAPIGNYVQMRAGVSFVPTIKVFDTTIDYKYGNPSKEASVSADAKIGWVNGKMLFDVYPFRKNAFRVTIGFFAGTNALANAQNTSPVLTEGEGLLIGDKAIFPDKDKNIKIAARINTFKPYVGIGYGRAVPKSRVNVGFDLGVMFWGKPTGWIWGGNADKYPVVDEWQRINKNDFDSNEDQEIIDAFDTIEKLKVGPVLNIRVGFRIF